MTRRLKMLSGLSTIALSGALALGACARQDAATETKDEASPAPMHHGADDAGEPAVAAGGEAEGAAVADAAADKSAYLSALQVIRGHLRAGVELYAQGDRELGPQHLRHPQAEMLTTLAPALTVYGAADIEPAIDALASAGEAGEAPARIRSLEDAALAAIASAGAAADASLKDRLLASARTLTVAGDEYSVAVNEGVIVNLHEYHDAYGFIATVIADVSALSGRDKAEKDAIAAVLAQARIAATAAPAVSPPTDGFKPASVIYGAAARAEIAARAL